MTKDSLSFQGTINSFFPLWYVGKSGVCCPSTSCISYFFSCMSEFESSREFVLWIMYQNRSQQSWMCEDNWQMKRILIFHQVFGLNECICEYPHVARPRQEKAAFTWDIYSITNRQFIAKKQNKTKKKLVCVILVSWKTSHYHAQFHSNGFGRQRTTVCC